MHERPADLTDAELSAALAEHWRMPGAALDYLPVGYGGYHWSATDAVGHRWFVTASKVSDTGAFADLAATMAAAARLETAGLDFVVAPRLAADGTAACLIRPGWAVTLFPFAAGAAGGFGEQTTPAGRAEVAGLLASLHGQDPGGFAVPVRPLVPGSLPVLEQALRERGRQWRGGPYSAAARALVSEHAAGLASALAEFAALCAAVTAAGQPLVLTHGEAHPGNLLRRDGRYLLIDWDTAGLALPERDLWWIASDSGAEAARYAELTGRQVSQAALELYRLRWELDDTGLFIADFRAPHADDEDARVGWAGLAEAVGRLSAAAWRTAGF